MKFNQHILSWYQNLKAVSADDKADFEVMLMDRHHDADAVSATVGIMTNLMQNGFESGKFNLLTQAAQSDNLMTVRSLAINGIVLISLLYDPQVRQSADTVENIQDVLVNQQSVALAALITFNAGFKHLSAPALDVRKTLIYRLVVVGEKANQAFDQSCC